MDGFRWERESSHGQEGKGPYDDVLIADDDGYFLNFIAVPVDRFGEFAAFVAGIAREVGEAEGADAPANTN